MTTIQTIGHLVKDPEKNGDLGVRVTIAVNQKQGDSVVYFSCLAPGRMGEACLKYLHKGDKVCVCGNLAVKKDYYNIYCSNVEFLNSPKGAQK